MKVYQKRKKILRRKYLTWYLFANGMVCRNGNARSIDEERNTNRIFREEATGAMEGKN